MASLKSLVLRARGYTVKYPNSIQRFSFSQYEKNLQYNKDQNFLCRLDLSNLGRSFCLQKYYFHTIMKIRKNCRVCIFLNLFNRRKISHLFMGIISWDQTHLIVTLPVQLRSIWHFSQEHIFSVPLPLFGKLTNNFWSLRKF